MGLFFMSTSIKCNTSGQHSIDKDQILCSNTNGQYCICIYPAKSTLRPSFSKTQSPAGAILSLESETAICISHINIRTHSHFCLTYHFLQRYILSADEFISSSRSRGCAKCLCRMTRSPCETKKSIRNTYYMSSAVSQKSPWYVHYFFLCNNKQKDTAA